jgi:hypothetical protein
LYLLKKRDIEHKNVFLFQMNKCIVEEKKGGEAKGEREEVEEAKEAEEKKVRETRDEGEEKESERKKCYCCD